MILKIPRRYIFSVVFFPSLLFAFSEGDGSSSNPFQISSVEQFDSVRYYCGLADSETYFKLMNDIDLTTWLSAGNPGNSNEKFWLPIGDITNRFHAKLDGNNHKISGLKINGGSEYIGLFGCIGAGGRLQNICLEIKTGDTVKNGSNIGGLVGRNDSGTVSNSYVIGTVSGYNNVGGLIGWNNSGTVNNCHAIGSVSGITEVGGLVGWNFMGTVNNSYATGTISGTTKVGGLVGWNDTGTLKNSYGTGSVNGVAQIGGLVGYNDNGTVNNSYATGATSGDVTIGGLVGDNDNGSIKNCYATGSVSGNLYTGGLIGVNNGTISNCYAIGEVRCNTLVGGLVGNISSKSIVTTSYWDKQTTKQNMSAGSDSSFGKTTEEMKTQSTFFGWDFDTTWVIVIDKNNGYPFLKWQFSFTNMNRFGLYIGPYYRLQRINKNQLKVHCLSGASFVKARVFTMTGRELTRAAFFKLSSYNCLTMNIDNIALSPGTYILNIKSLNQMQNFLFIY